MLEKKFIGSAMFVAVTIAVSALGLGCSESDEMAANQQLSESIDQAQRLLDQSQKLMQGLQITTKSPGSGDKNISDKDWAELDKLLDDANQAIARKAKIDANDRSSDDDKSDAKANVDEAQDAFDAKALTLDMHLVFLNPRILDVLNEADSILQKAISTHGSMAGKETLSLAHSVRANINVGLADYRIYEADTVRAGLYKEMLACKVLINKAGLSVSELRFYVKQKKELGSTADIDTLIKSIDEEIIPVISNLAKLDDTVLKLADKEKELEISLTEETKQYEKIYAQAQTTQGEKGMALLKKAIAHRRTADEYTAERAGVIQELDAAKIEQLILASEIKQAEIRKKIAAEYAAKRITNANSTDIKSKELNDSIYGVNGLGGNVADLASLLDRISVQIKLLKQKESLYFDRLKQTSEILKKSSVIAAPSMAALIPSRRGDVEMQLALEFLKQSYFQSQSDALIAGVEKFWANSIDNIAKPGSIQTIKDFPGTVTDIEKMAINRYEDAANYYKKAMIQARTINPKTYWRYQHQYAACRGALYRVTGESELKKAAEKELDKVESKSDSAIKDDAKIRDMLSAGE